MRKFLTGLIVIPLGIIFLIFAVANRQLVTVSFDPFNAANPTAGVNIPLFVVIILTGILGILTGSCVTWLRQRHWRKAAREAESDAARARAELADIRAKVAIAAKAETKLLPPPATPSLFSRDAIGS